MQSNEAIVQTAILAESDRKPRVEFRTVSEPFSVPDLSPDDCVLKFEKVTVQRAIHPLV